MDEKESAVPEENKEPLAGYPLVWRTIHAFGMGVVFSLGAFWFPKPGGNFFFVIALLSLFTLITDALSRKPFDRGEISN